MRENLSGGLALAGVLTVVAACLGPVWRDWSGSVVAPFGGIDAMLQLGLLEWTARHWTEPSFWVDLPIFFPVPGALGFMDSLLGQAWLVAPVRLLFHPTVAVCTTGLSWAACCWPSPPRRCSGAPPAGQYGRRGFLPWPLSALPIPNPRSGTLTSYLLPLSCLPWRLWRLP